MIRAALALAVLFAGASAVFAQPDPQREAETRLMAGARAGERKSRETAPPLALAMNLALGATIWAQVEVSTAGPVVDIGALVRQGYYKRELIQLVLMSAQAHKPLREAVELRKKDKKLEQIAQAYRLDYDKIYEAGLAVEELVDKYLPRFPDRKLRREKEQP